MTSTDNTQQQPTNNKQHLKEKTMNTLTNLTDSVRQPIDRMLTRAYAHTTARLQVIRNEQGMSTIEYAMGLSLIHI